MLSRLHTFWKTLATVATVGSIVSGVLEWYRRHDARRRATHA